MKIDFQKLTLPNGIRLLSEKIEGFPTTAFGIWVNVGSRDEAPQENGLTHFIEHLLFKGTKTRSAQEIAKEMDRLGGYSNAFTSRENTCFHGKVLPEDLPRLMELLADIFLNSRFPEEDIEREKYIIRQEIKMIEDSPEELVHDLFSQFFWGGASLGQPVLGSWETVSRFDQKMVKNYFQRLYTGERVVVAAAGAFETEEFFTLARKYFSSLPTGSEKTRTTSPKPVSGLKVYPKELEQVHLVLGVPTEGARSKDRYRALLFNTLLGGNMSSRLFQEIREKRGLAYAVYSYLSLYEDVGLLAVYAAVERKDLRETLSVIWQEISYLMEERIQEEEYQAALDHLRSALLLSADSPEMRMTRLARNEILFGRYVPYEETLTKIKALKKEDLPSFARRVFTKPPTLVILGPLKTTDLKLPEDFPLQLKV